MLVERKNLLAKYYIIAVIILLIFFHYLGFLSPVENFFLDIVGTGQNKVFVFLTKLKYSFINYQEARNLKVDNDQLKHEINLLISDNSQLEAYKTENEKLRSLLNFKAGKDFDLVLANVIGKDTDKANTLIINRGTKDGVKEGLAAVVDNGIIVGKVIEAKDHLAMVLLLTDKLSQLAVSSQNVNKTSGLAEGEYGLSLKVSLIPQDLGIKEGDLFITSGAETNIPRGLIIGKVNRIISKENELFKSATISLLNDYNELTILSIVIPKEYK
jgi:rod shape-determining protein MreC